RYDGACVLRDASQTHRAIDLQPCAIPRRRIRERTRRLLVHLPRAFWKTSCSMLFSSPLRISPVLSTDAFRCSLARALRRFFYTFSSGGFFFIVADALEADGL